MNPKSLFAVVLLSLSFFAAVCGAEQTQSASNSIYNPGQLRAIDSASALKAGDSAPGFTLPSIDGKKVSLSDYRGKKNVVLVFVPAAFTPVCSQQWPGYNITREFFDNNNAILLGITVDNLPSLYAWTKEMGGLWFPVLSDFWPHGQVSQKYGILRNDGTSERAVFVIDKQGIIQYVEIHDINTMPRLEDLVAQLEKLPK